MHSVHANFLLSSINDRISQNGNYIEHGQDAKLRVISHLNKVQENQREGNVRATSHRYLC
jgi:hypothetical protein